VIISSDTLSTPIRHPLGEENFFHDLKLTHRRTSTIALAGFKRVLGGIKKFMLAALALVKTAGFCLKMIPPSVLCFCELLAPVQKR
jgi:hypothetical protein